MNRPDELRWRLITAAVALALASLDARAQQTIPATALPTGGRLAGGQATISQSGTAMSIVQGTPRAALDWQSFNIGANASVVFRQPSANAIALNRVLGGDPSQIFGRLSSNGQVFLTNPSGILFGRGAQVDVGGILATTLAMSTDDFMSGNNLLRGGGTNSAVLNQGTLRSAPKGYVALIAPLVQNEGIIDASRGTAALVAANAATVDFMADGLIQIKVDQGAINAELTNKGAIRADGGTVFLTAKGLDGLARSVVNNSGVIEARTVESVKGVIRLSGGDVNLGPASSISADGGGQIEVQGGTVLADGRIDASNSSGIGGTIKLLGDNVGLVGNARVDASGDTGGGTVLVGGDFQGKNPEVQNAFRTYFARDAAINADAIESGDGGKVIVWADDVTRYYGSISARGGVRSGNGGFAEVSGYNSLIFSGKTDLSSARGKAGTLLLDPNNINIVNGGAATLAAATGNATTPETYTFAENAAGDSSIDASAITALTNAGTNVTLQAHTDITVNEVITSTGAGALVLRAGDDVSVNQGITIGSGGVAIVAGDAGGTPSGVNNDAGRNIAVNAAITTLGTTASGTASGSISLTSTSGDIIIGGNITTGAATVANTSSVVTATSGNITVSAANGSVTGAGRLITGNAQLTGTANGLRNTGDAATSGNISVTAGAGGVSLSGADALTIGSSIVGVNRGTATGGNIALSSGGTITAPTAPLQVQFGDVTIGNGGTAVAGSIAGITAVGNVLLRSGTDITLSGPVSISGAGSRFVAQAGRHVSVNGALTTNSGPIYLEADSPHAAGGADRIGQLTITAPVSSNGGAITLIAGGNANTNNSITGPDGNVNNVADNSGFRPIAIVDAGAGGINLALSRSTDELGIGVTGTITQILGNGVTTPEFGSISNLRTTGPMVIGKATTAGTDGLSTGAQILTVNRISNTYNNSYIALTPIVAGTFELVAGGGGILLDQPLTSFQPTTITTTGTLTISDPINTSGFSLTLPASVTITSNGSINTGGGSCSGTGCPVTDILWDGGAGTLNWFDNLNWSTNTLPGLSNDVTIDSGAGTILISSPGALAKSLIANRSLTISGSGSLSLANASQITGLFTLSSGTLTGAGSTAVTGAGGSLVWSGGTMDSGGSFLLGGGNSGALSNALALNRLFENQGALTLSGASVSGTGSIVNAGLLTATSGTSNTINTSLMNVVTPSVGMIQLSGAGTTLTAANFPTNDGQIVVTNGGTFSTGANSLTNAATSGLVIDAGNYTTAGASVTTASGNLAVSGALNAGTITLLSGGGVTLNAGSSVTATGSTGDAIVISGASFTNNAGSVVLNPGSGRWLVYSTDPAGSFENGLTGVADPSMPRLYGRSYPVAISESGSHLIYSSQPTLTATADSKSKTYGGVDPTLTYSISGFINDDGVVDTAITAGLVGAPLLSTTTGATATAGTHTITAGPGLVSEAGYSITTANGTLSVAKAAALTATADDKSKTYGGADPLLTSTVSGTLYYSDTAAVVSGVSLATNTGAAATAGTHVITASGGTAANYEVVTANGTLSVAKAAALTATADDKSKTYGGADPLLTSTVSGTLYYSDTAAVVSGVSLATNTGAAATAGTHVITASGGTAANYEVVTANGTLSVAKAAALTATADDKSKTYGGADPLLTSTVSGTLYYSDTAAVVSGVSLATNTGAAATAGTHVITASGGTAANYEVVTANGTLSVAKAAALTATADDKSKTYGGADPLLTSTVSGTLYYSDTAAVVSGVSLATNTGAAATAGTHVITASGGTAANYEVVTANGTLSVAKAAALTATADDKSKTYGGADPLLTSTVSGTLYYSDTAAVVSGVSLATNTGAAATAGTHVITASGGTAANYEVVTANGTLSVAKAAALTATADDKSKTYGGADPLLTSTVSGTLYYSDTAAVVSGVSLATNTGAAATAGTHVITASGGTAANYEVVTANGTLSVAKAAALTATADDKSKTYGGADPLLTSTVSGTLYYSDTAAVVSGVSLATNTGAAATAGTHVITASGGTAANYEVVTANGTLSVAKAAALTATADDKSKTYGGADPLLTSTVSGTLYYSDTAAVVSGVSLATNTGAAATAGTHVITASGGTAANYEVVTANGTLSVAKAAALTATADDKSKTYGGADPLLTSTVSGTLYYSDTAAVVSGVSLATNTGAAATAGTHVITASGGTAANYEVVTANGTLSVAKAAALTATADDKSKTYGGADPLLTSTVSGTLYYSDTAAVVSGVSLATNTGAAATAGTHVITASGGTAANYEVVTANGTLSVAKAAALTATADDKSKTYGGADPLLTSTVSGTLYYSDTAAVVSGVSLATNTGAAATAGTHVITASGGTAANYEVVTANGTLSVAKAAALTATADDKSKTYGGADPLLTSTVSGTLYYSDTAAVVSGVSLATNTGAAATAGTHVITASGGTAANYEVVTANGTLSVAKAAALTATADDKSKTYGGADPLLTSTVSGTLYYSDTAAVVSGVSLATNTGAAATAGTHVITASGGTAANYEVVTANGTLSVAKAAALTATADDKSKTYGGADPLLTSTVSGTLYYSDTAAVVSGVSLATNTGAAATAGTHVITASGGTAANYEVVTANGTLSVAKAAALTATADDKSKTYGGADPLLTSTVSGTLYYSDTAAVVSGVSLATNTGAAATAGTHVITASGGTAANYEVVTANGTLSVAKAAALTATADDKSKTYGGADPLLTSTVSGTLYYSDTAAVVSGVSLATNTGAAATAGTHVITASGGTAANYEVVTANGTLSVAKAAALTATADDKSKTYGGADPLLTSTVSGTLYYSDTAAVVSGVSLATNTGAAATAGTHVITASGGTAANYEVVTANGTLSVAKAAALTATADDKSKTYGGADPLLTSTVSGTLYYSDTAAVVSGVSLATNTGAAATAGTHVITASGGTAANYEVVTANGTLSVAKAAALTATADDKSKTYGGADPLLTSTVSGTLYYSDTAAVVSGVSLATNTGAAATAGTHVITASGGTAANYEVVTANGTLSVAKAAALTATADDKSKTYGGADPLLTSTVSGTLYYSDTAAVVSGVSLATNTGAAATAGTHVITASGGTAANYEVVTANGTLSVAKAAALTATADDKSKTYGGADPLLTSTVSGTLYYSDTAAVVSGVSLATNTGAAATAGTHVITASGGTAANYEVVTANGTLSVAKAAALTATADDKSKTYGGADPLLTSTVSGTLYYSDTAAVVSGVSLATNTGAAATAGTHVITASGGTAANYEVVTANGTLSVAKAALTVMAQADNRGYNGTTNSSVAPVVSGTLYYSDTAAAATQTYDTKHVGTGKTLTAGGLTVSDGNGGNNYSISYVPNTSGVITAAPLTISAVTDSRQYNGTTSSSGTPTVTAGTVYTGDSLTGLSQAFASKNVQGTNLSTLNVNPGYTLSDGNPTPGNNYAVTLQSATGTITAAPLTVAPSGVTLSAGATVPTTATITVVSGSVGAGDQLAASLPVSTTATATSPAGTYVLIPSGVQFLQGSESNYNITYQNGSLSIVTAQPLSLTSEYASAVYSATTTATSTISSGTATTSGTTVFAAAGASSGTGSSTSSVVTIAPTSSTSSSGQQSSGGQGSQQASTAQPGMPGGGAAAAAAAVASAQLVSNMMEQRARKLNVVEKAVKLLEQDPTIADLELCDGPVLDNCIAVRPAGSSARGGQQRAADHAYSPGVERKVALLIGVSDYQGGIPTLSSPAKDVQAIGKIMQDKFGYEVRTVLNPDKARIVHELNRLILESNDEDSIAIMYAGHGHLVEKTQRGYWIPGKASPDDPKQWISNQDIARALGNISAKQIFLVSDSCYSGTLTREAKIDRKDMSPNPQAVLERRSVTALSSGGDEPVADEGKDGHSVFAWHLMEQLKAVKDVSLGVGVYEQIAERVKAEIPQTPQYGASPRSGHQRGGDYLFEVRQHR